MIQKTPTKVAEKGENLETDRTMSISDKSDFTKIDHLELDNESPGPENKQMTPGASDTILRAIMKSKVILSFGYKSYVNYWFKMFVFGFYLFFRNCFSCHKCFRCCRATKHSSMTARKYKRAQNAYKKINEEIDLI